MVANHLTIASVPFNDLVLGHGFGLGVGEFDVYRQEVWLPAEVNTFA
jgi:hypothetical protein